MLGTWRSLALVTTLLVETARAVNFPFESVQLTNSDVANFSAIGFGTPYGQNVSSHLVKCKAFPDSEGWPSNSLWSRFNDSIDGALLKPVPLGASCYPGPYYSAATCRYLVTRGPFTRLYLDDPLTVLTQWTEGSTCVAALNPKGNCTQGGYPVYVVNATTVKHIQGAVNFARNNNIRLVIKNTGHDFGGRSVGAGSLSIWTHNLKEFEFLPEYTQGEYTGMAARIGAGLEGWEVFNYMAANNITIVMPGDSTVGANGGWFGYGGHGTLTSFYGLGSDQALSIEVVTADGRLVTADPNTNEDLWYAIRGGGGGTYGVVTSVIVKAYPPIMTATSPLSLTLVHRPISVNVTAYGNGSSTSAPFPIIPPGTINDTETFWRGISIYYRFSKKVVDAGGLGFSYIYPLGNNSFTLSTSSQFPNMSSAAIIEFMQPLYDELNAAGINITNPRFMFPMTYGSRRPVSGDGPANTRYRSRFFPRENWEDDELWNGTMAAIRASIEAGYTFHGILHGPSEEVAGWPGRDSAVNPAWRRAVMHASLIGTQPSGITAQQAMVDQSEIQTYMDMWRDVTPGSGSYMNEGDPLEPDWQQAFFGDLYPRLSEIKRKRDPWGLFWAPTTVGSEAWEVRAEDGYPGSQNGRLCRVEG